MVFKEPSEDLQIPIGAPLAIGVDNSAMYKEWKKQRSTIPKIDFNVSEEEGFFINIKAWGDYQVSEEEFN